MRAVGSGGEIAGDGARRLAEQVYHALKAEVREITLHTLQAARQWTLDRGAA
jgi:hypothetical protein